MTVLSLPKRDHVAPLTERVAEEIRALAARHRSDGVNQTVLASVIGITQSQMSKRLLGKTPFTLAEMEAIAEFFGVEPAQLLGSQGSPPTTPEGRESTRWYARPAPRLARVA